MNPLLSLPDAAPAFERLSEYLDASNDKADALITAEGCWSYAQLRAAVSRASGGMHRAGLKPGSYIAPFANPGPDFWVSFLATVRAWRRLARPSSAQHSGGAARGATGRCAWP